MKAIFISCVLASILTLLTTTSAQSVPASQVRDTNKATELVALEKKLLGHWKGPACAGDYTFNSDGTFELTHFTPGSNTLTGLWSIRWDALPPTLVLTCKTSDYMTKDPTRPEYEYLGKARESKLVELNDNEFAHRYSGDKSASRYTRPARETD